MESYAASGGYSLPQHHAPQHQHHQQGGVVLLEEDDMALKTSSTASYDYTRDYSPTPVTHPRVMPNTLGPVSGRGRPSQRHAVQPSDPMNKLSISSIDTIPQNYGAFRPGGPVALFGPRYIGFLLNWLLLGFFAGVFGAIVNPLFVEYMHFESYQAGAVASLIDFAWNFKFVLGFLSDCVPINRKRRTPYIYLGWFVFTVVMIVLTVLDDQGHHGKAREHDDNHEHNGRPYIVAFTIASFARLLVNVACEGMMVEFAHREGETIRGRTQCIAIVFRYIGGVLGSLLIILGCHDADYGGTFEYAIPLRGMFGIWAAMGLLGLGITWFTLVEEQVPFSTQPLHSQMLRVWRILQQRTTWQIMVFGFMEKCAFTPNVRETKLVYTVWLGATPLELSLAEALGGLGSVLATVLIYKRWLNMNWRKLVVVSLAAGVLVTGVISMLTIYDVVREQALLLLRDELVNVFDSFIWVQRQLMVIEIADPGYEATTYAIITTAYNLAIPVVSTVANISATSFGHIKAAAFATDSSHVRNHVAAETGLLLLLRVVVVLAVLPLLPRQKHHAQERKISGSPNLLIPILLTVMFLGLVAASVTSFLLAVFESTACYKFAGGDGCGSH